MLVVVTKDVLEDSNVFLAAIAALEARMLVSFSVRNKFHHLATSVHNELICSNGLGKASKIKKN